MSDCLTTKKMTPTYLRGLAQHISGYMLDGMAEHEICTALLSYADLLERPQEAREPLTPLQKERNYKTHKTRMSDASSFDEICTECGATDFPGSDLLDLPCPKAARPVNSGENRG